MVGFKLSGQLREGVTATDLVLTVTQMLRKKGVVGKFVEFYGAGLDQLTLADRATIGNMAPEYGATCGFFPIDDETLDTCAFTGRDEEQSRWSRPTPRSRACSARRQHARSDLHRHARSTWHGRAAIAGPKRPQDRVPLAAAPQADYREDALAELAGEGGEHVRRAPGRRANYDLGHGDVVIAAITSCTNTSQPVGAGRRRPRRAEGGAQGLTASRG